MNVTHSYTCTKDLKWPGLARFDSLLYLSERKNMSERKNNNCRISARNHTETSKSVTNLQKKEFNIVIDSYHWKWLDVELNKTSVPDRLQLWAIILCSLFILFIPVSQIGNCALLYTIVPI